MSKEIRDFVPVEFDDKVIDVGRPRRHWRRWVIIAATIALIFTLLRAISIYVEALWFGSLGYEAVYWYRFRLQITLFAICAVLTFIILRTAFRLLERAFATSALERRTITVNDQPLSISPARIMRPLGWVVALISGLIFGSGMSNEWQTFALYLHQPATNISDPIFHRPLGFYLFTLPIYRLLSWWLIVLAFVILGSAILYTLLTIPQHIKPSGATTAARRTGYAAVSFALAGYLSLLAWRVYLSRYPHLWGDHQTFAGVTYVEANYLLPGLVIVSVALAVGAAIALLNAFTGARLRLLLVAVTLPLAVYLAAALLIPAYVTNFIVKPNELAREAPYIEHNIEWTRRAFGLDLIETREFDADTSDAGFNLDANHATLDNIRLWDWHALQDTLRQIQEIRTYYDFPDVDVDRYRVGGRMRQMMLAAREMDINKLPPSSRNWINERLIYTHGYGLTMNTVNGFTPEGMPRLVLSQ